MSNDTKKHNDDNAEMIRLNVFLQESGVASRRKADELIEAGVVKVNGKAVTQLGVRIRRTDKVHVHGKLLTVKSIPKVVYLLNKPDMCLTTRFDAKGRRTIFDLPSVKNLPPNVQAVGRLDYRSEGLLLLTNDGDLAYALTHPKFSVEKSYAVLVADGVTIEDVEKLRAGVMLDDGMAKALSVRMGNKERLGATRGQWLELVVTEGRNRLIRRMAEAIGLKVVRLVRVAMGDVLLPATLKPGQAIPVDSAARNHLEQIKADMLQTLGSTAASARSSEAIDDATRFKRKLKRQVKLNDEEYMLEASRRSAEASMKRKQRSQQANGPSAPQPSRGSNIPARSTDRPVPRASRSSDSAAGSATRASTGMGPRPVRREDGPTPRRDSAASPRRDSGASPRRDSGASPRRDSGASPRRDSGSSPRRDSAASEKPRAKRDVGATPRSSQRRADDSRPRGKSDQAKSSPKRSKR